MRSYCYKLVRLRGHITGIPHLLLVKRFVLPGHHLLLEVLDLSVNFPRELLVDHSRLLCVRWEDSLRHGIIDLTFDNSSHSGRERSRNTVSNTRTLKHSLEFSRNVLVEDTLSEIHNMMTGKDNTYLLHRVTQALSDLVVERKLHLILGDVLEGG